MTTFYGDSRRSLHYAVFLIFAATFFAGIADAAPCSSAGSGTALERAANGLSPGQWCDFDQAEPSNLDDILGVAPGDSNSVLDFSHGGQWDPVNGLWVVHGYGYSPIVAKMVVYKERTNQWFGIAGEPFAPGGNGHDYDQTAVDPETGYAYYRPRLKDDVWRAIWNDSTNRYSWSKSAVAPIGGGCPTQRAYEANGWDWDARRKGIVMLSQADGGVVCFWDRNSNTWRKDANVAVTGRFHQVAEYDPVRQLVWMNDYSSRTHWKDVNGSVSKQASNPPFSLGCCGGGGAISSADPITGNFVVTKNESGSRSWYEYDAGGDRWSRISGSMPPIRENTHTLGGPIADHGVIMYLDWNRGSPQVYLYRHSAGGAVASRPEVDFSASATSVMSGELAELTWSSFDASSCSASGGWSGSRPLAGNEMVGPLTAATAFTLSCTNTVGTTSRTVTVDIIEDTTPPPPPPPPPGGGSGTGNWDARSTHPDVVYANRFDDYARDFYANLWPNPDTNRRASEYDTAVKASGAGSLRFDFVPGGEGFGGELAVSLGDDPTKQFGAGDEFWVQWRQRFDPYVIDHQYAVTSAAGQWKQLIISQGQLPGQRRLDTRSCSENQIVVSNLKGKKYPQNYHGCWVYLSIASSNSSGSISRMNLGDEEGDPSPPRRQETWDCQYWPSDSQQIGCKFYRSNQWMTFVVHVKLGPAGEARSSIGPSSPQKGFINSTYELYVAYEGEALELAHRVTGMVFRRGNYEDDPKFSSHQAKFGMFRWLPFISFKDGSEDHPVFSTWIDEIIISRSWIGSPDGGVRPMPPGALE